MEPEAAASSAAALTAATAQLPPGMAALYSLAVLVLLVTGTVLASPSPKSWQSLTCEPDGKLSHTKALSVSTWAVVAFAVIYCTFMSTLSEWLLMAFAALGSGHRLVSKWMSMKGQPAAPAPAAPDPAPDAVTRAGAC